MKTVMVIALLALAPITSAQVAAPAINDEDLEKLWFLFVGVKETQNDRGGSQGFLQQSGISDDGAEEFGRYALRSLEDMDRAQTIQAGELCAKKEELKASRNAFADHLERNRNEFKATRISLVQNLGLVLSEDDEQKLRTWALAQPSPKLVSPPMDIVDAIRAGMTDHAKGIENACKKAVEAPQ